MDAPAVLDSEAYGNAPDQATTVECRVVRVVDGDTIEVTVQQVYRVRLLDCWAPETHGPDKADGLAAKEHLRNYIEQHGMSAVLSVPWHADVAKSWTMGRVLGNVWMSGQEKSLSEIQVESGHAKKAKQ